MGTYTSFDRTKPDGSTQNGSAFSTSANANDSAIVDALVMSQVPGMVFSVSGGTASEPSTMTWANGAYKVRASLTWGTSAGENGQLKAITWERSINDGTTWDTPSIAAQTASYDASGNLTATTNAGGFGTWLMALIGKLKQHIAKTYADGVHGMGAVASWAANACAFTGGTMSGVAITASTASLTYERETRVAKGNISASTQLDWATAGLFTATVTGASAAFTHTNLPSGVAGFITVDITNGALATLLFSGVKWSGGTAPTFTNPGRDVVTLFCHDGATITGSMLKDVK